MLCLPVAPKHTIFIAHYVFDLIFCCFICSHSATHFTQLMDALKYSQRMHIDIEIRGILYS